MKLSKRQLKQIIKEELGRVMESWGDEARRTLGALSQKYDPVQKLHRGFDPSVEESYAYWNANPPNQEEMGALIMAGPSGLLPPDEFYDLGRRPIKKQVELLKKMRGEGPFPELDQTSPNPDTRTSEYFPELDQTSPIEEAAKVRRTRKK